MRISDWSSDVCSSDLSVTSGKTIGFIIATIFIDAIGFGIIMPVLPQLVMEVGRLDLPHAIEVGAWVGLVMAVATVLASSEKRRVGQECVSTCRYRGSRDR